MKLAGDCRKAHSSLFAIKVRFRSQVYVPQTLDEPPSTDERNRGDQKGSGQMTDAATNAGQVHHIDVRTLPQRSGTRVFLERSTR